MKISFLGLILLCVPTVKIKEACRSRSQRQTTITVLRVPLTGNNEIELEDVQHQPDHSRLPVMQNYGQQEENGSPEQLVAVGNPAVTDALPFDLLIIGLGVQGTSFLEEFSHWKYKGENKLRIGAIEMKSNLGPGLPYDEDIVTSEHLLYFFEATAETQYLEKYWKPHEIDEPVDAYDRVVLLHPPPRYVEGNYLVDELVMIVGKCENNNYEIELMGNTTAVNVERLDSGGFTVTLSGDHQGTITATDIVLSTGYWNTSRFEHEGYFESPWPASKLKNKIQKALHVAIFGCGLSAIDAALTLAHKFGRFVYKDKRFHFEIKKEYVRGHFKITMYCRSGHLPPVAAIATDDFPEYNFFSMAMLIEESDIDSKTLLPLDNLMTLLKQDLAALIPDITKDAKPLHEMNTTEFIDHINYFVYKGKDYKQRLVHDIEQARKSINENIPLLVPVFFHYLEEPFKIFMKYLSAEDTITYKKYIAPAIAKWYAPITPHNAEKMFALMNASCLFLEAVGDESKVIRDTKTNEGVHIRYKGKEIYHRYFIDALGQSGDISKDPSILTQNLIKNELIQPLYIPYGSTERGSSDLEELKQKHPDSDLIKEGHDNLIYHKADGIVINWKTLHAIPVGQTEEGVIKNAHKGVIYATGPFTYRSYMFSQALSTGAELAKLAVTDFRNRRFPTWVGGS